MTTIATRVYTIYEEEWLPVDSFPFVCRITQATVGTPQQIDLVSVDNFDAGDLSFEARRDLQFFKKEELPYLFRVSAATDKSDASHQLEVILKQVDKEVFLQEALEDIDGFDGVLLAEEFHRFIVNRDGECPYTVAELDAWLGEDEEEEGKEE